jgi:hypothetical protein
MRVYRIAVIVLAATVVYLIRLVFLCGAAVLYIYLLPSLLAEKRNPVKMQPIVLLNLLAGWLVIPWIVALILAYKMDSVSQSTV